MVLQMFGSFFGFTCATGLGLKMSLVAVDGLLPHSRVVTGECTPLTDRTPIVGHAHALPQDSK